MSAEPPPHAVLLRDFANTVDADAGTDALTSPADLSRWLHDHGLLPGGTAATARDLRLAHRLRAGLRAAMAAHHGNQDAAKSQDVTARLPVRLDLDADPPRLRAVAGGVAGALTELVIAVADAAADGSWERLKICPAGDCRWAFFDASKNQSRTWCAMRVCGNRAKTRSYRARTGAGAVPVGTRRP
ncbi:MAG: CGNR zinc finger domain-containing protein [Actinomycetota bacterium]|nr:CGNR zinc finger domain-containing protein [Actinomycetota bacterium]